MPQNDDETETVMRARDALIERARMGELSADGADAEATRAGLGPLATTPDLSTFDPLGEPQWSLPMAVSWIAWRFPDRVTEASDGYTDACFDWHNRDWRDGHDGTIRNGWFLEQREPTTLAVLELCDAYIAATSANDSRRKSIATAKTELTKMLSEGVLTASALDVSTNAFTEIDPAEWRTLRICQHERDVLYDHTRTRVLFTDVSVPSAKLVDLWPASVPPSSGAPLARPSLGKTMTVYDAARWIAAEGVARADEPDIAAWTSALEQIVEYAFAREIDVAGLSDGGPQTVDHHAFFSCKITCPLEAAPDCVAYGDELRLVCRPWHRDGAGLSEKGDTINGRHGRRWWGLAMRGDQIIERWPFGLPASQPSKENYRTGLPGKPTSKLLILKKFEERVAAGAASRVLAEEARWLAAWLKEEHPLSPRATERTIETLIRNEHRTYKSRT